jgi:hypothetical protein
MNAEALDAIVADARATGAAALADSLAAPVAEYNALLSVVARSQAALVAQVEALRLELAAATAKAPHAGVPGGTAAAGAAPMDAATQRINALRDRLARLAGGLQALTGRMAALQGAVTVYEQQHRPTLAAEEVGSAADADAAASGSNSSGGASG